VCTLKAVKDLEEKVNKIEYELQKHYLEMGKSILEIAETEKKQIDYLTDSLIDARKQLSAMKEEIQCQECMTLNEKGSHYCKSCGKKLIAVSDGKENIYGAEQTDGS